MLQIKLQTSSELTDKQLQRGKLKQTSSGQVVKKKQIQLQAFDKQAKTLNTKSNILKKNNSVKGNQGKELINQKRQIQKQKKRLLKDQQKALKPKQKRSQSETPQEVADQEIQNQDEEQNKASKLKVRISGGIILLILMAMCFVHGFTSSIDKPFFDNNNNAMVGASLMMASIFVVLGFGLVLTYHGENVFSSFIIVLYVVSTTLIISPFLTKFWLNLFSGVFFKASSLPIQDLGVTVVMRSNNGSGVDINYWNLKLSLCCAISQLTIYFATISRLQIYKIVISNFFFLVIWSLNYCLVTCLFTTSVEDRINDDFGICYVYLFGGFAGLIVVFDVPSKTLVRPSETYQPKYPKSLSLLGVFFLWMSFAFTYSIIGRKDNVAYTDDNQLKDYRLVFFPEGCLGMFFALSSSVLSTAAASIIFTPGNTLKLSDFMGSTISGAIMFGPVAGFAQNLTIPITLGIVSGALSTLYKSKLLPLINRKYLLDSMGFLGPFFLTPVLGNFIVTPVIVSVYSSTLNITPQLYGTSIQSKTAAILFVYFLVSSGIGMICGMMISWVMRVFKGNQSTFGDRLMFSQDLSLVQMKLDYQENSTDLFSSESSREENSSDSRKKILKKSSGKKRGDGRQSL